MRHRMQARPEVLAVPRPLGLILSFLFIAAVCLAGGCLGGGGGTAESAGSMDLSVSSTAITADGYSSVQLVATVTDGQGLALADAEVHFSTTLGSLSNSEVMTGESGEAVTSLIAGTQTGTALVTASAGSVTASAQVQLSAGRIASITNFQALPTVVQPGQSVTTQCRAFDEHGNPVSGATVTFLLTANGSGSAAGQWSVETTMNGWAVGSYTTGPYSGTDAVGVIADSGVTAPDQYVLVDGSTDYVIGSLSLEVGQAGGIPADGASSTTITATVTDTMGATITGAVVSFEAEAGTLSSTNVITNTSGEATVSLISSTTAGTYTVVARVGQVSNAVSVPFIAGATETVTLSVSPQNIAPGGTAALQAELTDAYGNPVEGEDVTFIIEDNASGSVFAGLTLETDAGGYASTTYTAGTAEGVDAFRARAANGAQSAKVGVSVVRDTVEVGSVDLALVSDSDIILADGVSSVRLQATVRDTNGNLVTGATVSFATTLGSLSVTSASTDETGLVETSLTSSTLPGQATVTARSGSAEDGVTVNFVAPSVIFLSGRTSGGAIFTQNGTMVANGFDAITASAAVEDGLGNPIAGAPVSFSFGGDSLGCSISPVTVTTDTTGAAESNVRASTTTGSITVVGRVGVISDSITVDLTAP